MQHQQQQHQQYQDGSNKYTDNRKMSAQFGQPNLQHQHHRGTSQQTIGNPAIGQSYRGSANQHSRIPSEQIGSQRTEPAHNPLHIQTQNSKFGSMAGPQNQSNITRKQSDFSFASGSQHKGSGLGSPAQMAGKAQGSYSNQFLERKSQHQRSGSLSKRSNNLNSEKSARKRSANSTKQKQQQSSGQEAITSSQTIGLSSKDSFGNLMRSAGGSSGIKGGQQVPQPTGCANGHISSIEEEEDQELEYGTQIGRQSESAMRQYDPREQTTSQAAVNQFMGTSQSSNTLVGGSNNQHQQPQRPPSYLQSIGSNQNTLMPHVYSQSGTPTSQLYAGRVHASNVPLQGQQTAYGNEQQPNSGGGRSSSQTALINQKLEQVTRYSELCEMRILDYQPDHPLPIRREHLGVLFAAVADAGQTSGQQSASVSSPQLASSQRQINPGYVHRFDPGNIDSVRSPTQGMVNGARRDLSGSPRSLKIHVDSVNAKNHQLEVALREETLANEEQRNYIQILKNVIEQKLERDGLSEMLKEASRKKKAESAQVNMFAANQKRRASPSPEPGHPASAKEEDDAINLYIVLSDMKYQLDSKQKEVQRFIEQLKTQDEYTRQLMNENQIQQQELNRRSQDADSMNKQVAQFEQELRLLHKQKDELLDCVESQVNQIENLKQDLVQAKSHSSSLEQQVRSQSIQIRAQSRASSALRNQTPSPDPPAIVKQTQNLATSVDQQININDMSNSLVNNGAGIDLSYSRELTQTDANQTMPAQGNNHPVAPYQNQNNCQAQGTATAQSQLTMQPSNASVTQSVPNFHQQVQIVNQAAINAANQSMTQTIHGSQESFGTVSAQHQAQYAHQVSSAAIESYQKHLLMKDQEILKLRSQYDQCSSELFAKQQELDSLVFTKGQLEKRVELDQERSHQQEGQRAKQLESAQSMLYDEQRKIEDLQLHYEAEVRKCQRELNIIREEQVDKDLQLDKIQKSFERQAKEIELKETQMESCKSQAQKDMKEIRELKVQLDEALLEAERLRKDRERRQDAELTEGKSKEQLNREKYDAITQLNEFQHQFEIFKTQKLTEQHKQDQAVRDSKTRVEVLEQSSKKQFAENEALQRDLTQTCVKLKQAEVQAGYLERSNAQLTDEVRQTKLDYDGVVRERSKLQSKIHDLEAQIETLSHRDDRNRKIHEQITEAQLQVKTKANEIEKLDDKLRKVYLQKEEFEVEAIQLRKTVHELQVSKNEYSTQKEMLTGQTKDNERRIFELIKEKQDLERKIRENVITIETLVEERDKFKRLHSEKEDEVADLAVQVKRWRSTNTDLKLIEEKVNQFLLDMRHVIDQSRHSAKPQLQEFLRLVKQSASLSSKVTMRKREQGYDHLTKLETTLNLTSQPLLEADDQTYTSQIWQRMHLIKDALIDQGGLLDFLTEMLHCFVADSVDLNHQLVHEESKVNTLQGKLGTIHSIDFKAQTDAQSLRKELLELQQQMKDEEARHQEQLGLVQQSLEERTMSEQTLAREARHLKKKLSKTMADTKTTMGSNKGTTRRLEKELWSATAEKNRFREVLDKLQSTVLVGSRAQGVVDDMRRCSMLLARADAERETTLREIDDLEQKLAQLGQSDSARSGAQSDPDSKFTAIQKVKQLRSELTFREDKVKDLDERISLEVDKMKTLDRQLKNKAQTNNMLYTEQTETTQTMMRPFNQTQQSPTHRNNLSMSPHRQHSYTGTGPQQDLRRDTSEGRSAAGESTLSRAARLNAGASSHARGGPRPEHQQFATSDQASSYQRRTEGHPGAIKTEERRPSRDARGGVNVYEEAVRNVPFSGDSFRRFTGSSEQQLGKKGHQSIDLAPERLQQAAGKEQLDTHVMAHLLKETKNYDLPQDLYRQHQARM